MSTGRTLPAYPTVPKAVYAKEEFTVINSARIPCDQVLGAYVVVFERQLVVYAHRSLLCYIVDRYSLFEQSRCKAVSKKRPTELTERCVSAPVSRRS